VSKPGTVGSGAGGGMKTAIVVKRHELLDQEEGDPLI